MATWEDLRRYIYSNYQVSGGGADAVRLLFDVGSGRSQNIIISGKKIGDIDYFVVWTPVCNESQIPAREALRRNMMPLLSLALSDDGTVILRYCALLKDLDVDEFEIPLRFVTQTGDSLEREFTGADRY